MAEPILQPTEYIQYPEWQPECRAAMLEIDPDRVKARVATAELAIAARSRELTKAEDEPERRAMSEEMFRMKTALAEVMSQHPDLEKK